MAFSPFSVIHRSLSMANFHSLENSHSKLMIILASITVMACLFVPLATSTVSFSNTAFDFPSFNPNNHDISFESDAYASDNSLQLTVNQKDKGNIVSAGRATYVRPMHLWDKSTGNVADFTTHFSFAINSLGSKVYADGMSFFLAPNGSNIPPHSEGGKLALVNLQSDDSDSSNASFVAVEFDTYVNSWDPQYEHIGIDINSVNSTTFVPWKWNRIGSGGRVRATIAYDSSVHNLSVLLIDDESDETLSKNQSSLSLIINLTEYLPEWVTIGFAATSGSAIEIHTVYSWKFNSSLQIELNENFNQSIVPTDNLSSEKKSKSWIWVVIGLSSAFLLISLIFTITWFRHRLKKDINPRSEIRHTHDDHDVMRMEEELGEVAGPKQFSYSELAVATDNFTDDRLLGQGGFGRVYEGYLDGIHSSVAVKKVKPEAGQGMKEYAAEVKTIGQLRHRNLVRLLGWCHDEKELLLVYKFMSNGSLDSHLFKGKTLLSWETRYKIAQGLASALFFLHEGWDQCVVHRDIKSSNVMLDLHFNAKLGDFGLARLVDHAKGAHTTILAGTIGYLAPECISTGKATKESDIYSFGVILLEIACGLKALGPMEANGHMHLVERVWEVYGARKLLDVADPKLCGKFNEEQMECLMIVGLWCAHPNYTLRPSVREAVNVLNFDLPPPNLLGKAPVPTYFHPPDNACSSSPSALLLTAQ
ncbi:hypothetical protein ACJRO7_027106 [Eucalyptus globulus]|uniref:non-specific serine/threonine protein kinase n=1 Tax=Eucalyptus globulus TaxID=34317 RepID=A0ABD3K2R0_EUCGL